MRRIDLNVDIAEGFGFDRELLGFASSANVCCGVHAGSEELAAQTVGLCRRAGVRVGAHPGYPDRAAMGRRDPQAHEFDAFVASVREQLRNFARFDPSYVKPHGALYNWLSRLPKTEVAGVRLQLGLGECPVMALAGTPWAEELGHRAIREGFADRRYLGDGTLAPRSEPDAVLHDPDEVAAQVLSLAERVDTICLHGDTEGCVGFAEAVCRALRDAGWEIGS